MYAILGCTGQVGGATAKSLLAQGKDIRVIVREASKGEVWAERGAEVAVADMRDTAALQAAFTGVEGVFIMLPACFYPGENYPETRSILAAIRPALEAAAPPRIVCLSSVGAQQSQGLGILEQLRILEQELGSLSIPSAFIRAAWFMDNSQWDIPEAKEGQLSSFLSPLDRPIPMVSTIDVGEVIAATLQEKWSGRRIIELEGPQRYSPQDISGIFARLLDRSVHAVTVPQEEWVAFFERQGAASDISRGRLEMLAGFNSGWIDFEQSNTEHITGRITMEEVLTTSLHKS